MSIKDVASQGGKARALKLSPERRKEIARAAIAKRWKGTKKTDPRDEYIQQLEHEKRLVTLFIKQKYRANYDDFISQLEESIEQSDEDTDY